MKARTLETVLTPEVARSLVRFAALRTGSAVFDEDLVQEALPRGVKAFGRAGIVRYPSAFFFKIVRDTVRDYWRGKRFFLHLEDAPSQQYLLDVEGLLDHQKRIDQIQRGLEHLSSPDRELMVLHYFEGHSIEALAGAFGKSRSAIKMSLLRRRRKIADEILCR